MNMNKNNTGLGRIARAAHAAARFSADNGRANAAYAARKAALRCGWPAEKAAELFRTVYDSTPVWITSVSAWKRHIG
jgi:hypothetical protein